MNATVNDKANEPTKENIENAQPAQTNTKDVCAPKDAECNQRWLEAFSDCV